MLATLKNVPRQSMHLVCHVDFDSVVSASIRSLARQERLERVERFAEDLMSDQRSRSRRSHSAAALIDVHLTFQLL